MGALETKCAVRRPFFVVSASLRPGAIGVWSASVVTVISDITQSARISFSRVALMSSSLAMRSSAGRPWRLRTVRSCSKADRFIPIIGANTKLLTKVPLRLTSVAGAPFRKPLWWRRDAKSSDASPPGCKGWSKRKMRYPNFLSSVASFAPESTSLVYSTSRLSWRTCTSYIGAAVSLRIW